MVQINISFLKPGMKLLSDLKNPQGNLLLPAGSLLDERSISRCKKWGIMQADVEKPQDAGQEDWTEIDPELLSQAKEQVRELFSRHKQPSRFIKVLARETLQHKAAALASEESAPSGGKGIHTRGAASEKPEHELPKLDADEIVANTEELASLPEVFAKIINSLNDPDTTADSLAEIISYDVNLSAKLIKLVNSPLYGLIQEVDSISRAISLLGIQTVKNLAVNASVMEMFKDLSPELLDMHSFWKHSISCGVVAQLLWSSRGRKGEEIFFLSGTLHDIGRLIILKERPEYMRAVLLHPERGQKPLYQLEKKIWGFAHFELGAKLINSWNFPLIFSDMVKYHHFPKRARHETEAATIHFADIIVHALELGESGEKNVPPVEADLEKDLGISLKELRELLDQIKYLVDHVQQIFFLE